MKRIKDKFDISQEAKVFKKENFKLYFTSPKIKQYIENVIKVQETGGYDEFFPSNKDAIERLYNIKNDSFKIGNIKYNSIENNLDEISRIIANFGNSGLSYLKNVKNVININKPLLLFYGIEQLSFYFINLHFNFTEYNAKINKIRHKFRSHGIGNNQFATINPKIEIDERLNKKIRLKKNGLASRFFITIKPSLMDLFFETKEISLIDLLKNFFWIGNNNLEDEFENIIIPSTIIENFSNSFGTKSPEMELKSPILEIYLLSYIFCHLCRYKMDIWMRLLNIELYNINFYIRFFITYARNYFFKILFNKIFLIEDDISKKLGPISNYIGPVYSKKDFFFYDYDDLF